MNEPSLNEAIRPPGRDEREERQAPSVSVLLLNQTLGLAAVLLLLFLFLPSDAGARVMHRFPPLRRAAEASLAGLAAPGAFDLLVGFAAGALMLGWNVLHQSVLFRNAEHGRGEVRIEGGGARAAAAYLVLATSFNEEVIFRGWLFTLIDGRFGWAAALAGSSLLFALVHTEKGIHGRLTVFVYGLVLGSLWLVTGSIWACALAHASLNGFAFFRPRGGDG